VKTEFTKLNEGWNADPNAPDPKVTWQGGNLHLSFYVNAFEFPDFDEGTSRKIVFEDCRRYRIGTITDEGWYRGHCRFSRIAPDWGEFYEVTGGFEIRPNSGWVGVGDA